VTDRLDLLVAAMLAGLLALAGTPLAAAAARATGFLDRPEGALKRHAEPTPYLGGLAVFLPFLVSAALVFTLDQAFLGVLLAATLAALLGLMDDFGAMRPAVKLAGQLVVILVLVRADVRIDVDVLPTGANIALTALWMLTAMNAVNFLDVVDGLAAVACLVAAAFLLLLAVLTDGSGMASIAAALLGALAGYLRYSLPQARIFLGDCGSLFLGATLGAAALALDYTHVNRWALAAPLLILAVPLFEIAFTVAARCARGLSPWRGSPDHVALRLRRLGLSVPQVLVVAASAGVVGGCLGAWLVLVPTRFGPWVVGAAVSAAALAGVLLARAPDPAPAA
jgi:UDP-GlcNAc:undecaprenyl-phosphate GlcNAc-1-phosphate transferase